MNTKRELERQRLHAVAEEYTSRGYRVLTLPVGGDLPAFIGDYQPDLIAIGPNESVVIEVKTRADLIGNASLEALARRIEREGGWRLEVVVVGSGDLVAQPQEAISLDEEDIKERFTQIEKLLDDRLTEPALTAAWALVEATLRLVAIRLNIQLPGIAPQVVIATLYSEGVISFETYIILRKAMPVRNAIVHGFKSLHDVVPVVQELLSTIQQLLAYRPETGA